MKLNEWICATKKANEIYFYKGHNETQLFIDMFLTIILWF